MASNLDLSALFFSELKRYNLTNFKTIFRADLSQDSPTNFKAFSAVVTRFFIFCEKHPELTAVDRNILFFKLKIDMIARYFSEYPASSAEELRPFQLELQHYVNLQRGGSEDVEFSESILSDKLVETAH